VLIYLGKIQLDLFKWDNAKINLISCQVTDKLFWTTGHRNALLTLENLRDVCKFTISKFRAIAHSSSRGGGLLIVIMMVNGKVHSTTVRGVLTALLNRIIDIALHRKCSRWLYGRYSGCPKLYSFSCFPKGIKCYDIVGLGSCCARSMHKVPGGWGVLRNPLSPFRLRRALRWGCDHLFLVTLGNLNPTYVFLPTPSPQQGSRKSDQPRAPCHAWTPERVSVPANPESSTVLKSDQPRAPCHAWTPERLSVPANPESTTGLPQVRSAQDWLV
jgi:hypothetical protein